MSDGAITNSDTAAAEEQDAGKRHASDLNNANRVVQSGAEVQTNVNEDAVFIPSSSEQDAVVANEETPSDASLGLNRGEVLDEQDNNASVTDPRDMDNVSTVGMNGTEQESHEEEESGESDQSTAEVASRIEQFLKAHKQWKVRKAILSKESNSVTSGARIAILDAMTNSRQVELHSLKTMTNHNGQVGTVVSYLIEKDRFAVKVNDQEFSLRAENLRLLSKEAIESNAEANIQLPLSLGTLASALFREGMLFKGIISVPGFVGQRQEYQLVVESSCETDEMGRSAGILARHKAYDDEQYAFIQVDTSSGNLSIRYADEETQCSGTWNMEKEMFEGSVRQLIPTEDGGSIYFAQDNVTHTFTLAPTTAMYPNDNENGNDMNAKGFSWVHHLLAGGVDFSLDSNVNGEEERSEENGNQIERDGWEQGFSSLGVDASLNRNLNEEEVTRADNGNDKDVERVGWEQDLISNATKSIANLRRETDQLGFELGDKFEYMCAAFDSLPMPLCTYEDLQSLVSRLVLEVRCSELIAIDSLAAEKTCTLFRRWASLLDKLTFASAEERETVIAELQEKGMTRVCAHKKSDNHKVRARQCFEYWSLRNSPGGDDMARLLVMSARLDRSYKRFDEALRRAEVRLTDDDFQKWLVSNETGDDVFCTICHAPLNDVGAVDDEKVLCLPCSHRFHIDCLREWLHHHSQCPLCRFELLHDREPSQE